MSKLEFNIAGPCIPGEHYILDPLRGINDELMSLIDGRKYFVIHAARQTGKTTLLDTFNSDTGWLVIFDKDNEKSWDEKIFMKTVALNGKNIIEVGC